jgi:hypothetical protein
MGTRAVHIGLSRLAPGLTTFLRVKDQIFVLVCIVAAIEYVYAHRDAVGRRGFYGCVCRIVLLFAGQSKQCE